MDYRSHIKFHNFLTIWATELRDLLKWSPFHVLFKSCQKWKGQNHDNNIHFDVIVQILNHRNHSFCRFYMLSLIACHFQTNNRRELGHHSNWRVLLVIKTNINHSEYSQCFWWQFSGAILSRRDLFSPLLLGHFWEIAASKLGTQRRVILAV